MYDYIKGTVVELSPTSCVVEAGGVGYRLNISLTTFSALENMGAMAGGKAMKVYTHLIVREDEHLLYGFADKTEREIFVMLISVSGVGAGTARTILSSMIPVELAKCIAAEDVNSIKRAKGLGLKTSQKIIIELKDKVKGLQLGEDVMMVAGKTSAASQEATAALVMLGYSQAEAAKVVSKIVEGEPSITVEKLIKEALRKL